MPSNDSPDPKPRPDLTLDLERGLPTTPADVAALRRARAQPGAPVDMAAYLRFLASFPEPSSEQLRARGPTLGAPFRLPEVDGGA